MKSTLNNPVKLLLKLIIGVFGDTLKSSIVLSLAFTLLLMNANAQDKKYTLPSWWFGVAGGANLNFYRGTTQMLNNQLTVPKAFQEGFGAGLYLAGVVEYYKPDTYLGFMLHAGYDNRSGKYYQVKSPCNCPMDLQANFSYLTIEPSLRFAPFKNGLYLYAGPRLAINLEKSFAYQLGINPAFPNQTSTPEVKGDFSNTNSVLISAQLGVGYDIRLTPLTQKTQIMLSPFAAFQPYFGQDPRSGQSLNITTLRLGIALKFGHGKEVIDSVKQDNSSVVEKTNVNFWVVSPKNIPVERRVKETFPLRNYIFFDNGSSQIPSRYKLLKKNEVQDFKEQQLEVSEPKQISGRSAREIEVYYNVLNILGDRMNKNPNTTIVLVGSSRTSNEEAMDMAEAVKKYLVNIFSIDKSRITTEGSDKPKIPSEQAIVTKDSVLLREGDRRVSIESSSSDLLMEFQSGNDVPLKPIELVVLQKAPVDSYVTINVEGATAAYKYWALEITDMKGKTKYFGPYEKGEEKISIPGISILDHHANGDYKVKMIGHTKLGNIERKDTTLHMVLWKPEQAEEGRRYSVIFEYNQSKTIAIYEKYLSEIVAPKVPNGGIVNIHGYTDIIGDEAYNAKLSLARANEVMGILSTALTNAGKTNVKFNVQGFGEDENLSPFDNKYPEERFYNRTVIIDIFPGK